MGFCRILPHQDDVDRGGVGGVEPDDGRDDGGRDDEQVEQVPAVPDKVHRAERVPESGGGRRVGRVIAGE